MTAAPLERGARRRKRDVCHCSYCCYPQNDEPGTTARYGAKSHPRAGTAADVPRRRACNAHRRVRSCSPGASCRRSSVTSAPKDCSSRSSAVRSRRSRSARWSTSRFRSRARRCRSTASIRSQHAGGYGVFFPERDPAGRANPLSRFGRISAQLQRSSLSQRLKVLEAARVARLRAWSRVLRCAHSRLGRFACVNDFILGCGLCRARSGLRARTRVSDRGGAATTARRAAGRSHHGRARRFHSGRHRVRPSATAAS